MNKAVVLFLFVACFLINGCLSSNGYTPNRDINHVESNKKYAITYSVDFISYSKEDLVDLKEDRIEWIKEYLEATGAFSDVSYRDSSSRSKYHIYFIVTLAPRETEGEVILSALTYCTIPAYTDRFYYDVTAFLFLNNELICAPSTSERISQFIWLPLFPAIFYPPYLVRKSVEKKCYRFLINEILEEHKKIVAKTTNTSSKTSSSTPKSVNQKSKQTSTNQPTTNNNSPSTLKNSTLSDLERSILEAYAETDEDVIESYRAEAEKGDPHAQQQMGYYYATGTGGVEQNYVEAVKWYRKSAEQGNKFAQHCLGIFYYNGHGVKQDYTEAFKWVKMSAEQGYDEAQLCLGDCYYYGEGVKKNISEGIKWYRKSAEQGNTEAKRILKELGY